MAYGITSPSQIIDLATITAGCNKLKEAVADFKTSGSTVIQAGQTCNSKALSVDEASLEFSITQLGEEMQDLEGTFSGYADQVIAEATQVYNAQVAEYEEYLKQLEEAKKNQNNK